MHRIINDMTNAEKERLISDLNALAARIEYPNSPLIGRETVLRYSPAEIAAKRRSKRPTQVRPQELQIVSNKLGLEAVLLTAKGGKPKVILESIVETVFAAFIAVEHVKDEKQTESHKWKWSELVTIKGFTMIFLVFMTFTKLDHRIDHLRLLVATRIAFDRQSTSVYPDFVEGIYYVVNISAMFAYGYVFLHVAIMHNTDPFYRAASVEVCRFIYQYLDQIYMAMFVAQEDAIVLSRGDFMLLLFSWCLEYGFVRLLLWNPNRRFRLKHAVRHLITSLAVNVVLVGIYFALNASKNMSLRNPTRVHDLTKPVGEQLRELEQERAQLSALHDWLVENDPSKNKGL